MPSQIAPCLWFNGEAEEAAKFYTSIFPDGKITQTSYFTAAGQEHHHSNSGSVMMVSFTINNTPFQALNGSPTAKFPFSPAISFSISCEDQAEIDHYWEKLGEGGDESRQNCGWLQDKFGVSWQIVPKRMGSWVAAGGEKGDRAMAKMMEMKKLEMEILKRAFEGEEE